MGLRNLTYHELQQPCVLAGHQGLLILDIQKAANYWVVLQSPVVPSDQLHWDSQDCFGCPATFVWFASLSCVTSPALAFSFAPCSFMSTSISEQSLLPPSSTPKCVSLPFLVLGFLWYPFVPLLPHPPLILSHLMMMSCFHLPRLSNP